MCHMLYLYRQCTGYRNINILRLLAHAAKFDPSNFFPIFGMVRFSWVLLTAGGLLRGRPSSSPWFEGGGGGPPPPVPGFPGSPGFPAGFPKFPLFGDSGLDGVFGKAVPLPLVSVSVVVVVPLIAGFGPCTGVASMWSMFLFGRGVLVGVEPVGYRPGKRSARGVYGGGFPLIYTGRLANRGGTRRVLLS